MIHTYIHTDIQTYRPSGEVVCRKLSLLKRGEEGRGRELKCYIHTYRQTDRHRDPLTKWVVAELSLSGGGEGS